MSDSQDWSSQVVVSHRNEFWELNSSPLQEQQALFLQPYCYTSSQIMGSDFKQMRLVPVLHQHLPNCVALPVFLFFLFQLK